jgi:hypothetical protein
LKSRNYKTNENPLGTGYTPDRLGGFLQSSMGTMQMFVELNDQPHSPSRKLTLLELNKMELYMIEATVGFLHAKVSSRLRASINDNRKARHKLVRRYSNFLQDWNEVQGPFDREQWLWTIPSYERLSPERYRLLWAYP